MKSKKIIAVLLASALSVSAAATVTMSVRRDYGKGMMSGSEDDTIVVDPEICALMGIDTVNLFSADTLVINHNSGTEYDTIDITSPSEYDDSVKTALVLKPQTDISNVNASDIIGISQDQQIRRIALPHLDETTDAGTYTVLMGGTKGNIYSGTFTISASEPATPNPAASDAPDATEAPTPTTEPSDAPTSKPSAVPTGEPAENPTAAPVTEPTSEPQTGPSAAPTAAATEIPQPPATDAPVPTPHIMPPPEDKYIIISYDSGTASVSSWLSINAVAVFAEYGDDNTLVSLETAPISIDARQTVSIARTKTVSDNNKLKIMIWDSLENMTPMCEIYSSK